MIGDLTKLARCLALAAAVVIGLVASAEPAQAYVGPGMALGALGAGIGLLMTAMSALFYMGTRWSRRLWRRVTGQNLRGQNLNGQNLGGQKLGGRSLTVAESARLHADQLDS